MLVYSDLVSAQLENLAANPSATPTGRVFYDTAEGLAKLYDGSAWVPMTKLRWEVSDAWDGSTSTKTYTVDGSVTPSRGKVIDARKALWQFKDETNNYLVMDAEITATSTAVTVTFGMNIPAGNYTLIGVE